MNVITRNASICLWVQNATVLGVSLQKRPMAFCGVLQNTTVFIVNWHNAAWLLPNG
jgi:hypothetical protein